jgi:hypothetical protein
MAPDKNTFDISLGDPEINFTLSQMRRRSKRSPIRRVYSVWW